MKKFLLTLVFVMVIASCAYSAENAILVKQPAYHNMSFYVFKPANVSSEYYVTFDGYYVYRDAKNVWHYASAEKSGILKTGYVVGSVIPSVVKLKPYNGKIASVNPILGTDRTNISASEADPKSSRGTYTPPNSELEKVSELSPNAADWTKNSNFMAVSKWNKTVDSMGVISRPAIPVAWKGDYPEVIYAWTGVQWRQINAKGSNTSMMSTIRRELYDLTVYTNQLNRLHWTEEDSKILAQFAESWGYKWQGLIIPGRVY